MEQGAKNVLATQISYIRTKGIEAKTYINGENVTIEIEGEPVFISEWGEAYTFLVGFITCLNLE